MLLRRQQKIEACIEKAHDVHSTQDRIPTKWRRLDLQLHRSSRCRIASTSGRHGQQLPPEVFAANQASKSPQGLKLSVGIMRSSRNKPLTLSSPWRSCRQCCARISEIFLPSIIFPTLVFIGRQRGGNSHLAGSDVGISASKALGRIGRWHEVSHGSNAIPECLVSMMKKLIF